MISVDFPRLYTNTQSSSDAALHPKSCIVCVTFFHSTRPLCDSPYTALRKRITFPGFTKCSRPGSGV
eukprot:2842316-Rhodomonas_salina.1